MKENDTRPDEPREIIWKQFAGKRIVFGGIDGPEYQTFFQNLAAISSRGGAGFRVVDGIENALAGDYVILFARPAGEEEFLNSQPEKKGLRNASGKAKPWDAPFEEPDLHHTWKKKPGAWLAAEADWSEMLQLLGQLRQLEKGKPQAVLLISGNSVYGTCFGVQHALREEELGSLCHTDCDDTAAQCMRTAEHFAYRLSAECRIPIRIARMGMLPDGKELDDLLFVCAKVLLYGANGEIYNLPQVHAENRQALTCTDAEVRKAERLAEAALTERQKAEWSAEAEAAEVRKAERPAEAALTDRQGRAKPTLSGRKKDKILRFPVQEKVTPGDAGGGEDEKRKRVAVVREEELAESAYDTWRTRSRAEENHSPLSPMEIVTDTQKADRLGK